TGLGAITGAARAGPPPRADRMSAPPTTGRTPGVGATIPLGAWTPTRAPARSRATRRIRQRRIMSEFLGQQGAVGPDVDTTPPDGRGFTSPALTGPGRAGISGKTYPGR